MEERPALLFVIFYDNNTLQSDDSWSLSQLLLLCISGHEFECDTYTVYNYVLGRFKSWNL